MKIKIGTRWFDKAKRRMCIIKRIELHDRLKCIWYVVDYLNGFTRNVFKEELVPLKSRKRCKTYTQQTNGGVKPKSTKR